MTLSVSRIASDLCGATAGTSGKPVRALSRGVPAALDGLTAAPYAAVIATETPLPIASDGTRPAGAARHPGSAFGPRISAIEVRVFAASLDYRP